VSARDLIDPESRAALDVLLGIVPGGLNAIADIGERRAVFAGLVAAAAPPPRDDVTVDDRTVPGAPGDPDVAVRVYRPVGGTGASPAICFIHGGGMVIGDLDSEDPEAQRLCAELGAVVVSIGYRLAPEHPYPAQVDDCYAGLRWIAENAAELGVDAARLVVYGGSAGGGLAIALALLSRDRGGPAVSFVMAPYPMLDDSNSTRSSHEIVDVGFWDRSANLEAWQWYLGGRAADQYAAPARATDLDGLPPMFLDVGTVDLFRDEVITFAQRLLQAQVPCELQVHPGSFHASESVAPDAPLSQRIEAARMSALRRALG
jgi:acetyl esterase/lipase